MTDLHPLSDAVHIVQRRATIGAFLADLSRNVAWSLVGLLLAAALLPLRLVLATGAVMLAAATAISLVRAWTTRPSAYESACRLDAAAGLHDRVSTAWHYRSNDTPDAMILRQRRDALTRLSQTDPAALFALQWPATAGRTLLLALAVAGLLIYRTSHQPPLIAAAERVASTAVARAAARVLRRPDAEGPRRERPLISDRLEGEEVDVDPEAGLGDGLTPGRQPSSAPSDGKNPSSSADPSEAGQGRPDGQQAASDSPDQNPRSGESAKKTGAATTPQGDPQHLDKSPDDSGSAQAQAGAPGPAPSLTDRVRQALKDLMAKATGEASKDKQADNQGKPGNEASGGPPNARKIPAPDSGQRTARANAPSPGESDAKAGGAGSALGANEAGEGDAPTGGRNQPGTIQDGPPNPALETHPTQEVVPLAPSDFKGEANLLTTTQKGAALLPTRDAAPSSTTSTNGTEQGDVPLRYRAYLQRYFNHPDEVRR